MKSLFNFKSILPLLALLVVIGVSPTAKADPIALGQNLPGPSNTTFQGGTLLASLTSAVTSATFTGTARSAVYRNAGGTLDFYYQFTNNGPSDIGRLTFFNFDGFTTDVFNVTNGAAIGAGFLNGTIDSAEVDRGANAAFNSVGYDYQAGAFTSNTTSLALLVRTNAFFFVPGNFSIIDGSTADTPTFVPGVPEPTSMLLLGTGLAGVAGAVRRKLRARQQN